MSDKSNNYNMNDNPDFNIIKAFLNGCENQNRSNLSVISSLCFELKSLKNSDGEAFSFVNSCAESILLQCSQMMKMTEIYYILYDSFNPKALENENVELCEYLEAFTSECCQQIGQLLVVDYKKSTPVYISIIKRLFNFVLAIFIRKAAVNGVTRIELSYNDLKNETEIFLNITERDSKVVEGLAESFSTDYADDIIRIAVEKMNSRFEISALGLKLIVPNEKNGSITMNSNTAKASKGSFSTLSCFFSDLNFMENDQIFRAESLAI